MILGGGFYTVGTLFFTSKFLPYNHAVWHLFAAVGSYIQFVAVYRFVLPLAVHAPLAVGTPLVIGTPLATGAELL